MNVMTRRAGNSRLRIADFGLRIEFAHVCRLCFWAGFPGVMAGLAETVGSLFTAERRPDAGLLPRTMDRMTVETKRFGDEAQVFHPFAGSRIVCGVLDPQLVRMTVGAEFVAERPKERRGLCPKVWIVATITGDLTLIDRAYPSGRGIGLRGREQGMMCPLRLFHAIAAVASAAEIGGGVSR